MVEQNTVNIFISVRITLEAYKRVDLTGKVTCFGHGNCKFKSYTRFYIQFLF